jgi:anhydro-N-acetylmuramic acid kinase
MPRTRTGVRPVDENRDMTLYAGLMSGTSLDGVDAVLADFDDDASTARVRVIAHHHRAFETELRAELMALQRAGDNELHRAALAANGVARAYALATHALLKGARVDATVVRAVGAHGQTVRHQPLQHDGTGYTSQLLAGALLAELVGIDVVCDLRSRDLAAGGQGAPLVPAFHAWAFGTTRRRDTSRAVLNLGGMANVTLLHVDGSVNGFDTGPGGALLDGWCERHRGTPYDDAGAFAASGSVDAALLQRLLADPYFTAPPPKSTGRDRFHMAWVDDVLDAHGKTSRATPAPADVQATLAELTATSVARALHEHAPKLADLILCGGGVRNADLVERLELQLPGTRLEDSGAHGIGVDQVEATAFAWLARAFVHGDAGNLPAVTGAAGTRRLGALYPAR